MNTFGGSEETENAYLSLVSAILKQAAVSAAAKPNLRTLAAANDASKGDNCAAYEIFLTEFRDKAINLLEIGIGGHEDDPASGGGSLRMWRDYFPRAQIYGIDLFNKSPHAEGRIHVRQGSQDDADFLRLVAGEMKEIDIVIDDGSHFSAHIIKTFETLFPYLTKHGLYIVEDVATSYWPARGGSRNLDEPWTTMNYFKRAADGVQWPHSEGVVQPTPITSRIEFVHFGQNFIVLRKI